MSINQMEVSRIKRLWQHGWICKCCHLANLVYTNRIPHCQTILDKFKIVQVKSLPGSWFGLCQLLSFAHTAYNDPRWFVLFCIFIICFTLLILSCLNYTTLQDDLHVPEMLWRCKMFCTFPRCDDVARCFARVTTLSTNDHMHPCEYFGWGVEGRGWGELSTFSKKLLTRSWFDAMLWTFSSWRNILQRNWRPRILAMETWIKRFETRFAVFVWRCRVAKDVRLKQLGTLAKPCKWKTSPQMVWFDTWGPKQTFRPL
jgi:hypothetical protein